LAVKKSVNHVKINQDAISVHLKKIKKLKWIKYLNWQGKVKAVECTMHSYAWSGKMPCTGVRRCIFCGKPE
jgi:hypothetical protein